jgi:hypothetical protein
VILNFLSHSDFTVIPSFAPAVVSSTVNDDVVAAAADADAA